MFEKTKRTLTLMLAKDGQLLNSIPSLEFISKVNKITCSSVPSRRGRGVGGEVWGRNQSSLSCSAALRTCKSQDLLRSDASTLFHKLISFGVVEEQSTLSPGWFPYSWSQKLRTSLKIIKSFKPNFFIIFGNWLQESNNVTWAEYNSTRLMDVK